MEERSEIEWILEQRRQKAIDKAAEKKKALKEKDPEYQRLTLVRKQLGAALLRLKLKGEETVQIEKELVDTEAKIQSRILAAGFSPEQMEPVFSCKTCDDTGRRPDGADCECKRQLLLAFMYENDPSRRLLLTETFDNFDLSLFRNTKRGEEPCSPRELMRDLKQMAIDFVDHFAENPGRNLLLYGPVGAGKSYLCHAMARALTDRGVPLVYQTAYGILSLFQNARFAPISERSQKEKELALVLESDLLFIDDLGTESVHTQSVGYFFELINDRLLTKRSTVISTNLEPREIERMYSPRVFSRLFGEYEMYHVFGDDLRLRI